MEHALAAGGLPGDSARGKGGDLVRAGLPNLPGYELVGISETATSQPYA